MLTSLGLIFLVGLSLAAIVEKIKLPRIIGMLIAGILLGPFVLDLLAPSILEISAELRKMALVIILIKAGLSLNGKDLKKVGRPALLLFRITSVEAAVIGAVLSAVSPAVVVPRMVGLIESRVGTKKGIPQMILAGASLDDVFVLVVFSTVVSMAQGGTADWTGFVDIPVSIVLGIAAGAVLGFALPSFFEMRCKNGHLIRNSVKVIIMLGTAFLLLAVEAWLDGIVAVSGLLAVISMAFAIAMRSVKEVVTRLQEKFGKLWLAAEVILFVLVGAAVDIRYTLSAGLPAAAMIGIALVIRSAGVLLCTLGTPLNAKERLFCVFSYLPKATVQAAIGSVPLALGLPCGKLVLSIAVLAILITAPLGALAMDNSSRRLLEAE
ncbi:MAG: cation:proton antiporter [bacterium]|nr:cation:proton antiporter [bacterium]